MLVLRCAACKAKLWKYDKTGPGEVLRCHKDRIVRAIMSVSRLALRSSVPGVGVYTRQASTKKSTLPLRVLTCGKDAGIDKGSFVKMISRAFTCSGTKRSA